MKKIVKVVNLVFTIELVKVSFPLTCTLLCFVAAFSVLSLFVFLIRLGLNSWIAIYLVLIATNKSKYKCVTTLSKHIRPINTNFETFVCANRSLFYIVYDYYQVFSNQDNS